MKKTKKGFTLVELLVVIAIIAILSTVAIVGYTSFVNTANKSAAQSEAHQIDVAIESALMNKKAVKLTGSIWVVKDTNGYKAQGTDPIDGDEIKSQDVEDLTADFQSFTITVGANATLTYASHGYTVNVDTNEIINQ